MVLLLHRFEFLAILVFSPSRISRRPFWSVSETQDPQRRRLDNRVLIHVITIELFAYFFKIDDGVWETQFFNNDTVGAKAYW
jgi:hypothetical protein